MSCACSTRPETSAKEFSGIRARRKCCPEFFCRKIHAREHWRTSASSVEQASSTRRQFNSFCGRRVVGKLPMDIVSLLPDTCAGRHTAWLWSRLVAMGGGSPPPDPQELAEHFAHGFRTDSRPRAHGTLGADGTIHVACHRAERGSKFCRALTGARSLPRRLVPLFVPGPRRRAVFDHRRVFLAGS